MKKYIEVNESIKFLEECARTGVIPPSLAIVFRNLTALVPAENVISRDLFNRAYDENMDLRLKIEEVQRKSVSTDAVLNVLGKMFQWEFVNDLIQQMKKLDGET